MDKDYYTMLRYWGRWYVIPNGACSSVATKHQVSFAVYSTVTKRAAQERIRKLNRIEAAKEVLRG